MSNFIIIEQCKLCHLFYHFPMIKEEIKEVEVVQPTYFLSQISEFR
jgi:hypothetical protein